MKKIDFIKEIAHVLNVPLAEAKPILDAVIDSMVGALKAGDRVELRGFGSLSTHVRGPRNGRNPQTGAHVPVQPKRVPKFRPSRDLLALVNGEGKPPESDTPNN